MGNKNLIDEKESILRNEMDVFSQEDNKVTFYDQQQINDLQKLEFNQLQPEEVAQHISDLFYVEICARNTSDFFDMDSEDIRAINKRSHQRINMFTSLVRSFKK
ncbi:hypothetical protein [Chondrinema litorale]|uniref:hypothetical protein n=1 Tax=Chondrinema litorale TaxID=2994555 RepID=UPI0025431F43|nr:hypothetical protein [Chondrinema litorale]UZS00291.1 hypothetical protein OQ292_40835 [Chondrinema litorale]